MKPKLIFALLVTLFVALPVASFCSTTHWIKEVSDGGRVIVLEDDSVWSVEAIDKIDSSLWLTADDVVVVKNDDEPSYPYLLVNTSENENVHAKYLGKSE